MDRLRKNFFIPLLISALLIPGQTLGWAFGDSLFSTDNTGESARETSQEQEETREEPPAEGTVQETGTPFADTADFSMQGALETVTDNVVTDSYNVTSDSYNLATDITASDYWVPSDSYNITTDAYSVTTESYNVTANNDDLTLRGGINNEVILLGAQQNPENPNPQNPKPGDPEQRPPDDRDFQKEIQDREDLRRRLEIEKNEYEVRMKDYEKDPEDPQNPLPPERIQGKQRIKERLEEIGREKKRIEIEMEEIKKDRRKRIDELEKRKGELQGIIDQLKQQKNNYPAKADEYDEGIKKAMEEQKKIQEKLDKIMPKNDAKPPAPRPGTILIPVKIQVGKTEYSNFTLTSSGNTVQMEFGGNKPAIWFTQLDKMEKVTFIFDDGRTGVLTAIGYHSKPADGYTRFKVTLLIDGKSQTFFLDVVVSKQEGNVGDHGTLVPANQ